MDEEFCLHFNSFRLGKSLHICTFQSDCKTSAHIRYKKCVFGFLLMFTKFDQQTRYEYLNSEVHAHIETSMQNAAPVSKMDTPM